MEDPHKKTAQGGGTPAQGSTAGSQHAQPNGLQQFVNEQLKSADAGLAPYAATLHDMEDATRRVADVLEHGVQGVAQDIKQASALKAQIVDKTLQGAGQAISNSHVLDGAAPVLKDALHQVDAALEPISSELKAGAAATRKMAEGVENAVTVTHVKDVAEVVSAAEDVYSVRDVVAGAGKLAHRLETPPAAGHGSLPFKEPSPTPKLVPAQEPAHVQLVTDAKVLDVDAAIDNSLAPTQQAASTEFQTTYRLKQGNFGEKMAADALAQQGHDILEFKPDIKGTNQGGIDIVTMKDGVVYAVDNKAYTTGKNVSAVSALDKNFDKNIETVRDRFEGYANDTNRSALEREKFTQAVEAIDAGRVEKVVTTAAFAPDGKMSGGITAQLENKGFLFQDVSPQSNVGADPAAGTRGPITSGGTSAPAPANVEVTPPDGGNVPRPAATEAAPRTGESPSDTVPRPQANQSASSVSSTGQAVTRPPALSEASRSLGGDTPASPTNPSPGPGPSTSPAGPGAAGGAANSGVSTSSGLRVHGTPGSPTGGL